jgi:aminoglycoside phosphotransferase (APT) family kinase protein
VPVPTSRDPDATRRQLESWLTKVSGARAVEVHLLHMPRQGLSSETIPFDAEFDRGGDRWRAGYVARVRPTGYTLFMEHDLAMQARVIAALAPVPGLPVPEVLGYADEEESPLGQPFFVMERVEGRTPPDHPPYSKSGWVFDARPEERRAMYRASFDILLRIHAVDVDALGLGFLADHPNAKGGMASLVERDGQMLDWVAQGRRLDQLDDAYRWLRDNVPDHTDAVFNWGDARMGNMLYRDFEPVAVLDWEMATLAPPEMDLGWWLGIERNFTVGFDVPQLAGFPSEEAVIDRYQVRTGHQLRSFDFYRIWAAWRIAVLLFRLNDMMIERGILPAGSPEAAHLPAMRALESLTG